MLFKLNKFFIKQNTFRIEFLIIINYKLQFSQELIGNNKHDNIQKNKKITKLFTI